MNKLFFALFPDAETALVLEKRARQLRSDNKLTGRLFATDRFHMSLHSVGQYEDLPQGKVEAARKAADTISTAPFDIVLERAESFGGGFGKSSLVLSSYEVAKPLIEFQHSLVVATIKARLRRNTKNNFEPHVTLLYDDLRIAEHPITPPIKWTVREFALVQSLVGQTRYISLGRWPLKA